MVYDVPLPLKEEHEALHERLRQATRAGGEVGELAKALGRLMHPHFVKEDQIALPPLGLLAALAVGEPTPAMAGVLALTDPLEAELPSMLASIEASSKRCRGWRRQRGAPTVRTLSTSRVS